MVALINPTTGTPVFGIVPRLQLSGLIYREAPIHLLPGKHIGPNRGFGAAHIWAEHPKEMAQAGYSRFGEVPAYVAGIIKPGTRLYFEGSSWRTTRLLAVRTATGTCILEFRDQRGGATWSVVTAFFGTKTHGSLVGTVR